jgi:hypothetical protein
MEVGLHYLPKKINSKKDVFLKKIFYNFYFFDLNQIYPLILRQKTKVNHLMISKKKISKMFFIS